MNVTIPVPYEDYVQLVRDSADKQAVINLLKTDFPDDTCQLIAIKSLLGIDKETEVVEPDDSTTTPDDSTTTEGDGSHG